MKKLRLSLDELCIESFSTTTEKKGEHGTVHAHDNCCCGGCCCCTCCQTCCATCQTCDGQYTCGGTCPAEYTCGGQWTCDYSACYGTCYEWTCNWDCNRTYDYQFQCVPQYQEA